MADDEGIGCETMRCDADDGSIQCKDVGGKGPGCDEKSSTEPPCQERGRASERQFDLHFDLLFNTVDYAPLETLLRPDRWYHAGVCKDIVVRPRTC